MRRLLEIVAAFTAIWFNTSSLKDTIVVDANAVASSKLREERNLVVRRERRNKLTGVLRSRVRERNEFSSAGFFQPLGERAGTN